MVRTKLELVLATIDVALIYYVFLMISKIN